MKKQQSFTDLEYSMRKRETKRDEFLETMEAITPWDEIVAMIEPCYYKNLLGRKPPGIEVMFRMYLAGDMVLPCRRGSQERDLRQPCDAEVHGIGLHDGERARR